MKGRAKDYPSVACGASSPDKGSRPRVRTQAAKNRGHIRAENGRNFCRYSVYDNKTDKPLIIDGTADECAAVLKRSRNSFYCLVNRVRKGRVKKYAILQRFEDEEEAA